MATPRLHDDGQVVTLDLHGLTVDEALAVTSRAVQVAAQRGRAQLRVIHGGSTSDVRFRNRTIKHALYDWLDTGTTGSPITGAWRGEDALLLSLPLTSSPDPSPIPMRDLLP